MSRWNWHLRIDDMVAAAERISAYTQGMSKAVFLADQKTMDAVLRNIEVFGEAAGHIPKPVRERHPEIRWADIKGMRVILAHAYFRVDPEIVWNVARKEIPDI